MKDKETFLVSRLFFPVLYFTIFLSFFRLGSVTLFDVDEDVFSEATKEMVESGNWITPTYNGENHYDKPILFYWIMTVSYKLYGINEFGARFPSAVASCLLIFSLFFFVKGFQDEKTALYAAISSVLSIRTRIHGGIPGCFCSERLNGTLSKMIICYNTKKNSEQGVNIYGQR
jgi:4-amino-4-deoxy-L-arabinose transferase-like glycosyltransferase